MYKADATNVLREAVEPGVITLSILISLAIEQGPKNEAGRLFLQDGIELDQLKEIRIEFLNILNIDYLWPLKNLVKLTLSHNIIERIENLDELIHLKELDLSFNRIKVMENMNNLDQLEILILFSNQISVVQGIDNLKKLIILNMGKNKIADWEHVKYLREFKALKSLNICENPCVEIDGYIDYLFAFVTQLLYYQYRMISESSKQSAREKHYRVISNIEENEAREQAELALKQKLEEKFALESLSYVEYLDEDYFFQQMSLDEGSRILSTINENTQSTTEEYKKTLSVICLKLYELGLQEHYKRTEEIKSFESVVNEGKENALNQARKIVDEVLEKKAEIFANIKDATKVLMEETETDKTDDIAAKARKLFEEFNDLLSNGRNQLMSKELVLHHQIKDINEVFKTNMTDMVNSFLHTVQEYFLELRNAEVEYNDTIRKLALYYFNNLGDEKNIPADFLNLCGDKDTLTKTLTASHNVHLQIINDRENRLINRLNNWLNEYTDHLIAIETKRNRQQILEISHFLGFQQQEFNSLGLPQELGLIDIDEMIDDDEI